MKLFTIFGDPVSHSKSPIIHNSVFLKFNLNYRYNRTLLKDSSNLRDLYFELGLSGASITVPHKETAFKICDEARGTAKEIQAVNCFVTEGDKIIGYNTDIDGFLDSIADFTNISKVLIIGAGGTARALTVGFLNKNYDIEIVNRSRERLLNFSNFNIKLSDWNNFEPSNYDLVVNVSSAGLKDESLPIDKKTLIDIFKNSKYAVDVIYKKTAFLKLAEEMGLQTRDGSMMLVYQGVRANLLFTDGKISREDIQKEMILAYNL
jgi:shikimate dehydrogenase